VGDIRIDFRRRNQGTAWVDGQAVREIAPIYFGVDRTEINPVAPPVFLPELAGKWVVARSRRDGLPDEHPGAAVIEIGERVSEELPRLPAAPPDTPLSRHRNSIIDDPDEMFPANSEIVCTTFVDETIEPFCLLNFPADPLTTFRIDFDSITDARVTVLESAGQDDDSIQYQLFKLNHD